MPALLVKIASHAVQRFPIDRETVVIGRSESVDVRIDDPAVSRVHCQVVRTPTGRWILQDFGSRNKTFLGDEPVDKHELIHGDTFFVGPAKIIFSGAPEDESQLMLLADRSSAGAIRATAAGHADDEVTISDDVATLASGDMTMMPDDPLTMLAEDSRRSGAGEDTDCPMCGGPRLPSARFCNACNQKLDERRQAINIRAPQQKESFWRRLFGKR